MLEKVYEKRNGEISPLSAEYQTVRSFVEDEMQLLDEADFTTWMELFSAEGIYWIPSVPGQKSWLDHVSLFFDDQEIRRTRIERLKHPMIHTQTPPSRACRHLSSVRIRLIDGGYEVRGKYLVAKYRPAHPQQIFAGDVEYRLSEIDGVLKINLKKVSLINCDASFPALAIPF